MFIAFITSTHIESPNHYSGTLVHTTSIRELKGYLVISSSNHSLGFWLDQLNPTERIVRISEASKAQDEEDHDGVLSRVESRVRKPRIDDYQRSTGLTVGESKPATANSYQRTPPFYRTQALLITFKQQQIKAAGNGGVRIEGGSSSGGPSSRGNSEIKKSKRSQFFFIQWR
ncbi:Hypothetical predicted protein [Prunus dulcis]|uniref:Uncharacterized protein n=1 Tax=Prunus dulcis TaxID=3755 RepID=A0A5E4GA55_PRUDU|nr:Hypothetical predicted protein [Prunus dulcis]